MVFSFRNNYSTSVFNVCELFGLVFVALLLSISSGLKAAPRVSPALIEGVKSLSPTEQRELAKQYGVSLPQGNETNLPQVPQKEREPLVPKKNVASAEDEFQETRKEAVLKRFGAQLFASDVETYAPLDRSLAPSGYLLGPGDELSIQVFGKDSLETVAQVDRSGQISIQRIGAIPLAGLTFE